MNVALELVVAAVLRPPAEGSGLPRSKSRMSMIAVETN
jgi:hypothetical protein